MPTYISILRGINVSGQRKIKMVDLQKLLVNIGLQKVETYIQSGNVVFQSNNLDTTKLSQTISKQIKNDYGFEVPVLVFSSNDIKKVIDNNPFTKNIKKNPAFMHVTFLANEPMELSTSVFEQQKHEDEEIAFGYKVIYLYCPNGYGKTKLSNNFIESKLKTPATTRNWKTVNVLSGMAINKPS